MEVPSGERLRCKGRHGVLCRLKAVWSMPGRFRVVLYHARRYTSALIDWPIDRILLSAHRFCEMFEVGSLPCQSVVSIECARDRLHLPCLTKCSKKRSAAVARSFQITLRSRSVWYCIAYLSCVFPVSKGILYNQFQWGCTVVEKVQHHLCKIRLSNQFSTTIIAARFSQYYKVCGIPFWSNPAVM